MLTRRIRARPVLWLLVAAASLALVISVAFAAWQDHVRTTAAAQALAEGAARALAGHADRALDEMRRAVEDFADLMQPAREDLGLTDEVQAEARRIVARLEALQALVAVDAAGQLRFTTTAGSTAVGVDLTHREYFQALRWSDAEVYLAPVILAAGTGRPIYSVVRRLQDGDRFAGVAIASARADLWRSFSEPLEVLPGSEIALYKANGDMLVWQRVEAGGASPPTAAPRAARMPAGPEDSLRAAVPLESYGVEAVVTIPRDVALAPWAERQKQAGSVLVLALAALLMFGDIGSRALRREEAGRAALEARTHELDSALEAQRMLTSEVVHRVKNSLQLAQSLLSLQRHRETDEGVRGRLQEAAQRIGAISKVHERLYVRQDDTALDFSRYLRSLCEDLSQSTGTQCAVTTDPLELPTDRAVLLGLIAAELCINAVKHGKVPGATRLQVGLMVDKEAATLTVADDGMGLAPGFDPEASDGLGMRIVTGLVQQLGGTLAAANRGRGACFTVTVPLPA